MTGGVEFEDIAAELYSGPLEKFIATRNARAKVTTDPGLAGDIRALRKPTLAAWVVNVFARERSDELGEALQLAAELREAQADLDAATLSQLGRQRRALTSRLAAEAASLAKARGARVSEATLEAVRQTISAAFYDPDAASAVASGRLVHDLEPSTGFPLDAAVGGPLLPASAGSPPPDEVGARRARRDAERALREAEQAREQASQADREAEQYARSAEDRARSLARRVADLEEELAQARRDAEKAQSDAAAAAERRDRASADLLRAETDVEEARRALEKL